jgi:hypothetical protein
MIEESGLHYRLFYPIIYTALLIHPYKRRYIMPPSPYRREVQDFIRITETLLSPASLGDDFTPEECDIIAYYVMTLSSAKNPWAKELTVRYA